MLFAVVFIYLELARDAYVACGGNGYGRVDIRTKNYQTCEPYVLEVNANCGLSFGSNSSSLGEVLYHNQVKPTDFCRLLVDFAHRRSRP